MQRCGRSAHPGALLPLVMLLVGTACPDPKPLEEKTYTNPVKIQIPSGGFVENCPDPSIIRGQKPGDEYWYLYCTSNPLNDQDKNAAGEFNYHLLSIHRSKDLVEWTYVGDAFEAQPEWAAAPQGFWAPDIQYFNGTYYLYYSSSETKMGGYAIGVATSDSPTGPWTHAPAPVVEPQKAPCCMEPTETRKRWVIDSNIVTGDDGQRYIYFGSYFGGIAYRKLSEDGLSSDPATQQEIISDDRYEGAYIVKRDNFYYVFVSATNCCNGPLTGYSVFAGRSESPTGPFVDRDGVPLTQGRVGGTPVLSMNGNRWVGPGHNSLFTDFAGQDWIVYHAIDRNNPYRGGAPSSAYPEKRPVLMDPVDWIDGWPTVRGGHWASDTPVPAPAAQPGQKARYQVQVKKADEPGAPIPSLSDEFDGAALGSQWSWVRPPAGTTFGLASGILRIDSQPADLHINSNNASVLTEPVPPGKNYVVETKVRMNVPAQGCCYNYTQVGLVIYGDDDNFIKLVHFALWNTRQIEFAKEVGPVPQGYPRYGNTVAGPPGEDTWLRIVAHVQGGGEESYTAYTSLDGVNWYRNGTYTHNLGQNARIGLVSMARAEDHPEFKGYFEYLRVYELKE
ncbi:family 43 glycosylhydrolase [Archangium sp.]|uniref:family 43 glycosylhydrolase n=1 Tax=Archangium sp. TaxID=1872627 RepID=UPI002D3DB546|nr:family 43 glycosylhydrolase [Archangium sp.]HYO51652.1 family 43 glycosylhydrolase [Archangium sp.]